jgi:hypothetical protein
MDDSSFPTDFRYCKVYHYFDRIERIHCIFVEGSDKPIYTCKWSWDGDYFPFAIIHDDEYGSKFYGVPLPKRMESLQRLINKIWSKYADAISHAGPAHLVRKGEFDRSAKEQTQSDEWHRFIEHKSRDINPVGVLPSPPIPTDLFNVEGKATEGMRAQSSLNEFSTLTSISKRLSAQETNAITEQGGVRSAATAQRFEKFNKEALQILVDLMLIHLSEELRLPIFTDNEKPMEFVTFNRNDFMQAKFMCDVAVGSTTVRTNQDRVKDIAFLLQSLQPYAQLAGPDGQPLIHFEALIRELLQLIPDLRHIDDIMHPPLTPQQLEQIQIQKMLEQQQMQAQQIPPGTPPQSMPPPNNPMMGQ